MLDFRPVASQLVTTRVDQSFLFGNEPAPGAQLLLVKVTTVLGRHIPVLCASDELHFVG